MSGKFQKLFKGCDVGTIICNSNYEILGIAINLCLNKEKATQLAKELLSSESEDSKIINPVIKNLELLPKEYAKSLCKTEKVWWFKVTETGIN